MKRIIIYSIGAFVLIGTLFVGISSLRLRQAPYATLIRDLADLTQVRIKDVPSEKYLLVASLAPGSRVILLGGLYGNDTSFNEILRELEHLSLLKKDILTENTYLLLNGNLIGDENNGPLLMSVAHLMKTNPNRLWYIRGKNEALVRIKQFLGNLFGENLTNSQLDILYQFFATLPIGIYLFTEQLDEPPLRISSHPKDCGLFHFISCTHLTNNGPIKAVCEADGSCFYPEGPLSAHIDSNDELIEWSTMHGLQFKNGGWHILSSPTVLHKQKHNYRTRSFSVLTLGATLQESTVDLYFKENGSFIKESLGSLIRS